MVVGEPPSTGRHGLARIEEETMKELSCSEMGIECAFRAEGETADEVKAKLLEHAAAEHADMLAGMTEAQKAEMMATMDEKIAAH
jgi:predicted small metal-binding protein